MEIVTQLLQFTEFRAIDSNDYNFILLDQQSMTEPWIHQKRALESMDDPIRQSTRIQKVEDVFYWIGQDGYPTAMWVPKNKPPVVPNAPNLPQPLQTPQVTQLQNWSEAKLDFVQPFVNHNGGWVKYIPKHNTIYAIIPGLNRVSHLMQAQDGADFNIVMQKRAVDIINTRWGVQYEPDPSYDHYAYRNPHGRNLRNLSKLVLDDIVEMIQNGNGPAAIVCGSRGGQETMLELTKYWRGLVFDFNGGFLERCQREFGEIPDGIQIVSVLGQLDFFYFKNRSVRSKPDFENLVKRKLDFLTQCVGNKKSGQHILYASSIIDHSLDELHGRNLILAVTQQKNNSIRTEDYVYKVHM
jgi:hypothetical protein